MVGNLHKILCCKFTKLRFLPARRYASAGTSYGPVSVRPSVCLSVCLSQVGVLSKRLNESGWFWHACFLRHTTQRVVTKCEISTK